MSGSKQRELLAVETLKNLGVKKVSKKEIALLLAIFGSVAAHERQRCIDHVRYCEERFSQNQQAFPMSDPALTAQVVAESLAVDLV